MLFIAQFFRIPPKSIPSRAFLPKSILPRVLPPRVIFVGFTLAIMMAVLPFPVVAESNPNLANLSPSPGPINEESLSTKNISPSTLPFRIV